MKTTMRSWRMAMRAATRKVLSPISLKRIMVKERTREWMGEMTAGSWSSTGVDGLVLVDEESGIKVVSLGEDGFSGYGMSCDLGGRSVGT